MLKFKIKIPSAKIKTVFNKNKRGKYDNKNLILKCILESWQKRITRNYIN